MKRLFVTIGAGLCLASLSAQSWTLEQCVDYAISHNIDVRSRLLSIESSRQSVTEAYDRFLPQVQGYAGQNFNFGRALTSDNTYANRNTSSTSFGAQLSLPLFQGLAGVRRVDYAKTDLAAAVLEAEAGADNVTVSVIGAYLQALYTAELVNVARERHSLTVTQYEATRALVEAGRKPELELTQASSQVAQAMLAVTNAENDSVMAMVDLAQVLNLENVSDFTIAAMDPGEIFFNSNLDEVIDQAFSRNPALRAAGARVQAEQKNISLARTAYIPTLNFSAGIGTNYYHTAGLNNENFSGQMRHNFSQSIGFSLSVPIFDGFNARNSIRRARLNHINAELQLDNTRIQLYKALVQAHAQAKAARNSAEAGNVAVEATRQALAAMQTRYDLGRANSTELEQARTEYIIALGDYTRARYEYLLRTRILNFYTRGSIL